MNRDTLGTAKHMKLPLLYSKASSFAMRICGMKGSNHKIRNDSIETNHLYILSIRVTTLTKQDNIATGFHVAGQYITSRITITSDKG
jgi:hypothetical protein